MNESKGEEIEVEVLNGFLNCVKGQENDEHHGKIAIASAPAGTSYDEDQEEQFRTSQKGNEEPPKECLTLYVGCLSDDPPPTEDDLKGFFTRHDINVAAVRVPKDTSKRGRKKGRGRTHAFVDFYDSTSFERALYLQNEEAVGLAASDDGKLLIQAARSGQP